MLDLLIRLALNRRVAVLAIAFAITVLGLLTAKDLPIDVFPDITKPTVVVMTEAHGLAPEEVETLVTMPIESQLNGLPGVERVRSQSGIGLSAITIEFQWGSDIYRNRQVVQEKLNLAKERLPKDANPVMGPIGSLLGQIQHIVVSTESTDISPMQLRSYAEWSLRPRLLSVPGVAQVIAIGGGLKQYQVLLSSEKINQRQISVEQIDSELAKVSKNTTGGFLEKDKQEFLIRNIGAIESIEDIGNTYVGQHFGRPILVKDIAEIREAPRLKRGDGSFNGTPSVILTIQKQPGVDTVKTTRGVEKILSETQTPNGIKIQSNVFRQADFIEASIKGIKNKLVWGALLVFAILYFFLANLRLSIITLTAIPLSFLFTAIVFRLFGLTVNTMTLGGLAIAIGELVDDSIVDVENVYRRLSEAKGSGKSRLKVIFEASSEVRNSIILATLIIVVAFLPIFQLTGLEGRLFNPLGIAYLTALMASLLVSLTVTPVLCFYLIKNTHQTHKETAIVQKLKSIDRKLLDWALPRSNQVMLGAGTLFLLSCALLPFMGKDFLPKFTESTAMVSLVAPPGISLTESNRMGVEAEKILLSGGDIRSTSRRTGRAELDEHAAGVNVSEIDVDFYPNGKNRDQVLNEARTKLKQAFPEIGVNIGQPISHLIDHMLSGVSSAIAIKLFGHDLQVLREKSIELKQAIEDIEGLVDLRVEQQGLIPQVKIFVLREEAAKYGLSPGAITTLLEGAFNGETVAQVIEDSKTYDVFFQFDEKSRNSVESMKKTILKVLPDGRKVLLQDVADVFETTGPNEINRENTQRRMVISANSAGTDIVGLVNKIQQRVKEKVQLPEGYYLVFGGQFESQQSASKRIYLFGILAIACIGLLLYRYFTSLAIAIQILATIPLAFVGGIVLLFITDRSVTIASLIGFVTLFGIASRNAVMMISHYIHLLKHENQPFTKETIIRGSQERLVPVLMTASVAALALLPLVFAKGQPGSEILHPVAVVIVGGLFTSTLLDMIVTPVLFYRFGRTETKEQNTEETL